MKRLAACLLVIMVLSVGCTSRESPQTTEHSESSTTSARGEANLSGESASQEIPPIPTYPVNGYGQTYGSVLATSSVESEPDLISAYGVDGTLGYVLKADLHGPMPKTPEEALAQQRSRGGKARQIPLYAVDGRTVIGVFEVGGGTSMYYIEPPLNSSVNPPGFRTQDPQSATDSGAAAVIRRFGELVSQGQVHPATSLLAPSLRGVYEYDDYAPLRNTPTMEIVDLMDRTGDPLWPSDAGGRDQEAVDSRVFSVDVRYRVLGIIASDFKDDEVYHHKVTVVRLTADGPWLNSELSAASTRQLDSAAR